MKCPYCGQKNETNHCKKCSAVFPVEKSEKTKEVDEPTQSYEPIRLRKKK